MVINTGWLPGFVSELEITTTKILLNLLKFICTIFFYSLLSCYFYFIKWLSRYSSEFICPCKTKKIPQNYKKSPGGRKCAVFTSKNLQACLNALRASEMS